MNRGFSWPKCDCVLAVSLTVVDRGQHLHPSSFWLLYLKHSQPAREATAGRAGCTRVSPFLMLALAAL